MDQIIIPPRCSLSTATAGADIATTMNEALAPFKLRERWSRAFEVARDAGVTPELFQNIRQKTDY